MSISSSTYYKPLTTEERVAPFLALLEARYLPLLCSVAPQSYAVFLWLWEGSNGSWAAFIFSIMGALGYESVYVGAIAWTLEGRKSAWTWATSFVALAFSVLVAGYVYFDTQGWWALLHSGFPLVGFCYTMALHSQHIQQAAEAAAIVEVPAPPAPVPTPTPKPQPVPVPGLADLLQALGKTHQEALDMLKRSGMMQTEAKYVYYALKRQGSLPESVTVDRFAVLLEELKAWTPEPEPADDIPFSPVPEEPEEEAPEPGSTALPDWLVGEEEALLDTTSGPLNARVWAALDRNPNLENSALYQMFPEGATTEGKSSIRVYKGKWKDRQPALVGATNGHER